MLCAVFHDPLGLCSEYQQIKIRNYVLVIVILVFGCQNSPGSANRQLPTSAANQLELIESLVVALPASDQVVGGKLLGPDSVAYWTNSSVQVLTKGLSTSSTLCGGLLDWPRAVAHADGGTEVEILDRRGIVVSHIGGRCVRRDLHGSSGSISSGIRTARGWVWVERDPDGVTSMNSEFPIAHVSQSLTGAFKLGERDSTLNTLLLSPSGEGFAVTLSQEPFAWAVFLRDSMIRSGKPPPGVLDTSSFQLIDPSGVAPWWITTGLVDLGSAFLQVIADLRSDRRMLLLFNASGSFVRATALDFPFGVLDSDPAQRRLLAIRRPDSLELVVYSWGWQAR